MEEVYLSGYLEGMLNLSSSLSKTIGPSFIKVHCYEKKTFQKEFNNRYQIKDFNLIETNQSLETTLLDWLGDSKIVESILYWFEIEYRGDKKVYQVEQTLINELDEKQQDFYSLEDLFVVECKKYMFVFLLGNNE